MKLVIPMPPNRANARGHWRTHHKARVQYWEALDNIRSWGASATYPGKFSIPRAPDEPIERANLDVTMFVHQRNDAGNAVNRCKWVEDWLVSRGYIVDDAPEYLCWVGMPVQIVDRRSPRIELLLEAA